MNVIVEIAGKEAIPVWTIPYITGRWPSPDKLLKLLAFPQEDYSNPKLPQAFNLTQLGQNAITPFITSSISAGQWVEYFHRMGLLETNLNAKKLTELADREEWCKRSIEIIQPCRAYIWLNEFEAWFARYQETISDENVEICLNPIIPTEHAEYFRNTEFVGYQQAKRYLEGQDFRANPEEIAMWISTGELCAYQHKKFDADVMPFKFNPKDFLTDDNYIAALEETYFTQSDIYGFFQPKKRYISRKKLIKRWEYNFQSNEEVESFINARTKERRLTERHPIAGAIETRGELFRVGVFDLGQVEEVEKSYGIAMPFESKKTMAEIKASRQPKSDWNIQQLIDTSVLLLIEKSGLLNADQFEYSFNLYSWIKILDGERNRLRESDYKDRQDYHNRFSELNAKIEEIESFIENRPVFESISNGLENALSIYAQKTNRKRKINTCDSEDSKPNERREFYKSIWITHGQPSSNKPILKELKRHSDNKQGIISNYIHNTQFSYSYQDGSTEILVIKTFQNDMTEIRKQN